MTRPILRAFAAGIAVTTVLATTACCSAATEFLRAKSGKALRWSKEEIALVPMPAASGATATTEMLVNELREAAAVWNRILASSNGPRLRIATTGGAPDRVRRDATNIVSLEATRRCAPDVPDDVNCFSEERKAITHIYRGDTGESIDEADIEVNGVDIAWRDIVTEARSAKLRAVLIHELGHLLGLEHSCVPFPTARPLAPGRPRLPPCVAPEAKASVMYPDTLEPGRSAKGEPGEEERATFREVYGERRGRACGLVDSRGMLADGRGATFGFFVAVALRFARRRSSHAPRARRWLGHRAK